MSSKYSTMIICRELFIQDIIDNLKQTINSILRKSLDLFQGGFKAFLIVDCPHRDREKREATSIFFRDNKLVFRSIQPTCE